MKIIRTDYDSELRSTKTTNYLSVEDMQFESASTNAQNVNDVAEAHQRTLIIMIKIALLADNISDFL